MTLKSLSLSLLLALAFVFPAAAAVHSRAVGPAASDVDVFFSFRAVPGVLPGGHVALTGAVSRAFVAPAGTDSVDATVTIDVPPAMSNITAGGEQWHCSIQSTTVTCTTALFANRNSELLNLGFDVPSSTDGGRYDIKATLATSLPNIYPFTSTQATVSIPRTFTVNTANDFGAGSLRDALLGANEHCDDPALGCQINFAGPMTIEPASPLPAITGCNVFLDGGVAQRASLDIERPVEISGAKAGFANGLEVRTPCATTIRGLTVNRFAANGIVVAQPLQANQVTIDSCFIGTDTTASAARPNGMRGIAFETPQSNAQIYNNTISGNRYSGIAIWAGSYVLIMSNRIGLGRDSRPLGNGASGVYVDGGQATIFSTIAYNHDFGVGIGPHAVHVDAPGDDLFANGVQDVDWGLDGMTPTDPTGRMPPVPVLIDATYDPGKGVTTIRGVLPAEGRKNGLYTVRLFRQTPTGTQALWPQFQQPVSGTVDVPFTLTFPSDLRGSAIAAQSGFQIFADEFPSDTSELSRPLVVR
ncbi:MAG: large repetitive protein [Thermoanaerobaculia bacterium]|jgi:parallel beta-helix repeat protein|nr:large repetitive protein [Thermoanaerobaculia bacterium]